MFNPKMHRLWLVLLLFAGCTRPEPETPPIEKFAVGTVLESPKTLQYDYAELIDATVGKVSRKAYEKYKDDPEAYVRLQMPCCARDLVSEIMSRGLVHISLHTKSLH